MPHRRPPFRTGERYHLYNRGNNSERIFPVEVDYLSFLDCIGRHLHSSAVAIQTLCLLPNHYHLSIKLIEEFDLSEAMRRALKEYAVKFNKQQRRHGHVFEGRFKSVWIDTDQYQDILSRYIHRNPVEAGLVSDPAAWPYSSYRSYARGEELLAKDLKAGILPDDTRGWQIPTIQTNMILGRFKSVEDYQRFVTCDFERNPWKLENGLWRQI